MAVEVAGYGTTSYIPDHTRKWRVLMEQTATTATLYLYGRDCVAERRDNAWLYHHLDRANHGAEARRFLRASAKAKASRSLNGVEK